jgi:hypothetical protein
VSSAPATASSAARLADALTALSLATDAGNGFPLEKSLRNAVIATRLGAVAGLDGRDLADVYYVALLRAVGRTAYAHETAALLGGDDVAFHGLYERLDPGHPAEFLRDVVTGMGAWGRAGGARPLGRALPHRRTPRRPRGGTLGVRGEHVGGRAPGPAARRRGGPARRLRALGRPRHPRRDNGRAAVAGCLLARGLTNKQIAAQLVVSPRTVQHHVAHIYLKIDRRTRAGAAMFAMEHGLAATE